MNERNIFVAALQRQNLAERSAFLDEACRDNAGLREQVETLLREHEQLGSFLECPAIGPVGGGQGAEGSQAGLPVAYSPLPIMQEGPGTVIGSYKLLEQIGEGGFG